MNNNNNQKSTTRKYSTATYTPRSGRGRKHTQNKMIFFVLLAILIIALIVAISFVIADLVGGAGADTTVDPAGTGSVEAPDGHAMSNAYDGDKATYMLSVTNQAAGSYFSCEFESPADVGTILLVSSEPETYIRNAELQLKVDGLWVTVGVFDSIGEKSYSTGSASFYASAIRVLLGADFDALWSVNELTVTDKTGAAVKLRSPAAGTNSTIVPGPEQTTGSSGESTTGPDTPDTTGPVTPDTAKKVVSNDQLYTGSLILVNAQYPYRFPASNAMLLKLYDEYYANDYHCCYFEGSDIQLEASATRNLFAMLNAMHKETGINKIILGTGYRSYETQQSLADRYPATAALPGYSEHHTGLGIDVQGWIDGHPYPLDDANATVQQMYGWINANAYKHGYVRRFAPDKDLITGITSDRWHYRYVGVPHAYYMTANNLCLEEYLAALEANCKYGSNHLILDNVDGRSYEIYFVPASSGSTTEIPVPADPTTYTISGNNYSGFVVTITRN